VRLIDNCTIQVAPEKELVGPQRSLRNGNAVSLPTLDFDGRLPTRLTGDGDGKVATARPSRVLELCYTAARAQALQNSSHMLLPWMHGARDIAASDLFNGRAKNQRAVVIRRVNPMILENIGVQTIHPFQQLSCGAHLIDDAPAVPARQYRKVSSGRLMHHRPCQTGARFSHVVRLSV